MACQSNPQNKCGGKAIFEMKTKGENYSAISGADYLQLKIYWGACSNKIEIKQLMKWKKQHKLCLKIFMTTMKFVGLGTEDRAQQLNKEST
eukprot:15366820-Ditylum_brightwellii.AAC.1